MPINDNTSVRTNKIPRKISYYPDDTDIPRLPSLRNITKQPDLTNRTLLDNDITFLDDERNRWTEQQESLLISWAEKSSGYGWLHNRCINYYNKRSRLISIPASILGYISGTATLLNNGNEKYANVLRAGIGICGICAGILANLQQIFTYKELSEQHRMSSLRFQSFFHDISCELSLSRENRAFPIDYIKMKRLEFDKMVEQSPSIPDTIVELFQEKFNHIKTIHKPENMNTLQTIIPYDGQTQLAKNKHYENVLSEVRKTNKQKRSSKLRKKKCFNNVKPITIGGIEVANSVLADLIEEPSTKTKSKSKQQQTDQTNPNPNSKVSVNDTYIGKNENKNNKNNKNNFNDNYTNTEYDDDNNTYGSIAEMMNGDVSVTFGDDRQTKHTHLPSKLSSSLLAQTTSSICRTQNVIIPDTSDNIIIKQ